ncbi:MAG: choice-of-anchor tandem repeat GloVer-containing protein, partial [Candidatus Sulfotelmatobacter sp.]
MTTLPIAKVACVFSAFCFAAAIASPAQTFSDLFNFDGPDGAFPQSILVQGTDGNFYGTTSGGSGTVFRMSSAGTLTTLYSFCAQTNCPDGSQPYAGLVQGSDGNFYGTAAGGGTHNGGTVFKITPEGKLTTLYQFCSETDCKDGDQPYGALIQGVSGNFFGTTSTGGANNQGTVFKLTPSGTLTTLYSFCAQTNCPDGSQPYAGLVQGSDGNFYGTTYSGGGLQGIACVNDLIDGVAGCGTIFKVTPGGRLTTLHRFDGDGAHARGGLVQGTNGNFYGTTTYGSSALGNTTTWGTVFEITPLGALRTLFVFTGSRENGVSVATLIQATDDNFYGTTNFGGVHLNGTIFNISAAGTLTTLHSFDGADGLMPSGPIVQATDGSFYGTTLWGGNLRCPYYGCGTIFHLSVGLGPFVSLVRSFGTVGRTAQILGQGFTGTTAVSFNGTAASFTV